MIAVLSGEGPTDLGQCSNQQNHCTDSDFTPGPMAILVDQIIESYFGYSLLGQTPGCYQFCSEQALEEREALRKQEKRQVSFKGKKRAEETGYYYVNAWMLGEITQEIMEEEDDEAVAILFRDSDGTHSSPRDLWQRKWDSMLAGFKRAGCERGVPMLPRPKSEAWLLCAAKANPYQHCPALEELPGNDDSPNSAKGKLEEARGGKTSAAELCDWLRETPYDHAAADLPSFQRFRERLLEVLS